MAHSALHFHLSPTSLWYLPFPWTSSGNGNQYAHHSEIPVTIPKVDFGIGTCNFPMFFPHPPFLVLCLPLTPVSSVFPSLFPCIGVYYVSLSTKVSPTKNYVQTCGTSATSRQSRSLRWNGLMRKVSLFRLISQVILLLFIADCYFLCNVCMEVFHVTSCYWDCPTVRGTAHVQEVYLQHTH